MTEESAIIRPGDVRIEIRLHAPLLVGQRPQFSMQVDGVEDPFEVIRILRSVEDITRNQAEQAVKQMFAPPPLAVKG